MRIGRAGKGMIVLSRKVKTQVQQGLAAVFDQGRKSVAVSQASCPIGRILTYAMMSAFSRAP